MSEIKDEIEKEASRPNTIFLYAASIVAVGSIFVYYFQNDIIDGTGPTSFVVLLVFLVLLALFLVLCYRSPRIGNRFLGFGVVIDKGDKKMTDGYHYSAGFKEDTGVEVKRMNSRRKQARYNRRKIAAVTREMQAEKAKSKSEPSDVDKQSGI